MELMEPEKVLEVENTPPLLLFTVWIKVHIFDF